MSFWPASQAARFSLRNKWECRLKSASVYQSECGSGFRLAPTCSFIRNGYILPRVSKAGVRLLHKDGQDTIAEIVEFDCISIFPGATFSSG
jgi:hypothetical protein